MHRVPAVVVVGVVVGALLGSFVLGACATPAPSPSPDLGDVAAELETQRADAASLTTALRAPGAQARRRAVLALARLERLDAIPGILASLSDVDADVRAVAAFAAGQVDLALDPMRPPHEAKRVDVEAALVARIDVEREAAVRLALLRALGRIAVRQGVATLVRVAGQGPNVERATALTALGVAGARRKASLSRDEAVRSVVEAGLVDADATVVTGAAYAAFRQRLGVAMAPLRTAAGSPEAQARIHVARALPFVDVDAAAATVEFLLQDPDWRVRVEAVRAVAVRHDVAVTRLPDTLRAAVASAAVPGAQHVAREVCVALAAIGAPTEARPAVEAAVAALPVDAISARCACAGTLDVLGGGDDALMSCATTNEQRDRAVVETIAARRIAAAERVRALQPYVDHDAVSVRVAAAGTLCAVGGPEAADAAATRLHIEEDPGVAGALLECFADDAHADVLRDETVAAAAARFVDAPTPEAREPLLVFASLARRRPALEGLVAQLQVHPDARVRDVAWDVPAGERAAGARATIDAPPAPATLPLAAVLTTSKGPITIVFERELAPIAVRTFVSLAHQGMYRGTPFHRVIADFVAQGGDPRGDGSGGPGFTIPCENSDASFTRGTVGIATAGKDTGGSQFFLVHSAQPHLDGRYTLFAHVSEGLAVMDALQRDDVLVDVDVLTALKPATPTTPLP
jgi:cyclophilin family peptidyl-prolyl cis-trans isomerase